MKVGPVCIPFDELLKNLHRIYEGLNKPQQAASGGLLRGPIVVAGAHPSYGGPQALAAGHA